MHLRLAVAGLIAIQSSVTAQSPAALTAADYSRAEQYLAQHTQPLVFSGAVRPNWVPDGRFWYRNNTAIGFEYIMVDPARRTRTRAFDHSRLAAALSAVSSPEQGF